MSGESPPEARQARFSWRIIHLSYTTHATALWNEHERSSTKFIALRT